MEHITIKNKYDQVQVSHKIEKNEQVNSMELDIINKREIQALLPVQLRSSLFGKQLRFEIRNHMDLRTYLRSGITFEQFSQVVFQIVDAIKACESHGIRIGNVQMDSDLSFYDHSTGKVKLLCWPLISLSARANTRAFLFELGSIYISQPDETGTSQSRDGMLRQKYLRFFDGRGSFDLDQFRQYVAELIATKDVEQDPWDINGGTIMLLQASLFRPSNQSTVVIPRFPFSIGRAPQFCDYAVEENMYISRKHVTIFQREGRFYIRDNGSANGSMMNGSPLLPREETELPSGARLRLGGKGGEEFIFNAAGG